MHILFRFDSLICIEFSEINECVSFWSSGVFFAVCSTYVRDHPYITSDKGLGGWVQKAAVVADVQHYIYADEVGGSEKVQNYSDVIYEWSLTLNGQGMLNKIIAHFSFCLNKGDLYKTAELCIHFACQGELSVF